MYPNIHFKQNFGYAYRHAKIGAKVEGETIGTMVEVVDLVPNRESQVTF